MSRLGRGLPVTLLQWLTGNIAFREIAYFVLCIAAGGKYVTLTEDDHIRQDTDFALSYRQPIQKGKNYQKRPSDTDVVAASRDNHSDSSSEFLSQILSGSHLDGMYPQMRQSAGLTVP